MKAQPVVLAAILSCHFFSKLARLTLSLNDTMLFTFAVMHNMHGLVLDSRSIQLSSNKATPLFARFFFFFLQLAETLRV